MNRFLRKRVDEFTHDLTEGYEPDPSLPLADRVAAALLHHRSGRMHMGAEIYRQVLADEPAHKDAVYLMAAWHLAHAEFDPAGRLLHTATTTYPDFSEAWSLYGHALAGVGRDDDAVAAYRHALGLNPRLVAGHFALGQLLEAQGDWDGAVQAYRAAASFDNSHVPSYVGLAQCFAKLHLFDESMSACHRALIADKRCARAHNLLGEALMHLGQTKQAADSFRAAVKTNPGFAEAYGNLGRAFLALQEPAQALEMCIQAADIRDDLASAYCTKGLALCELGRLDEAELSGLKALELDPENAEAHYVIGCAVMDSGRPEAAAIHFRSALEKDGAFALAQSRLLQAMQCSETVSPQQILAEAEDWGRRHSFSRFSMKPVPREIRRIGFVGADLNLHPIGTYVGGLLGNIDRDRYEVFVYANSARTDSHGMRIKERVDQWRPILGLDDDTVTEIVGDDKIDVLVDLSGHNKNNRLQILANHAAPVQVSWLGYNGTTGLPQVDALIGDDVVTPIGLGGDFAEKILRLDGPWTSYTPPAIEHDVVASPVLKGEPFTFGVFCHTAKINKDLVLRWGQILMGVPKSRILIKSRTLVSATLREQLYNWFEEAGVQRERVIFRQSTSWAIHFASFDQVDLMLDTYPFHSCTTTLESLWMGVPVVSRIGTPMHSRLSARVLEEVGLDGFVTESADDMVARAIAASQDLDLLANLRTEVRGKLLSSRMCDSAGFATRFMSALESLI